jgi:hypothetical protein
MGVFYWFYGEFVLNRPLTPNQRAMWLHFDYTHDCGWIPNETGQAIICKYDNEKFSNYEGCLVDVIDRFIKPWGYKLTGTVEVCADELRERCLLEVFDNLVSVTTWDISPSA